MATPEDLASTKRLTAIEIVPAVRSEVRMLEKRGAELIVVLAHATEVDVRDLVREVDGVDVVIRSPGTPITRKPAGPVSIGGTVILEAGSQGQHVGKLQVALGRSPPERPLRFDDGGYAARRRQEEPRAH